MLFTPRFTTFVSGVVAAMVHQATAVPAPVGKTLSVADVFSWLDTTHANVTFIGEHLDRNSPLSPEQVLVLYCSTTTGNVCSDPCTLYYGGPTCLYTPNTNCLGASADVYFCNGNDCNGICNEYDSCGVWLDGAYCLTPGTNSIFVPET